jgi:DNA-binding response OmpR family regulator
MHILIVEENPDLGGLWARHLEREGHQVTLVASEEEAIGILRHREARVIVLNVVLTQGSALAVADYASYRWPEARVVFVTNTTFFSDGSIFRHAANACAYLQSDTDPNDLAMMVSHYGDTSRGRAAEG